MSEPADNGIIPRFYIEAVKNNFKSEEAGHPVFEEIEFLEIRIAGDMKNVVTRKVEAKDAIRWPTQYAQFKAQESQVTEGYPIADWPAISRSNASMLKSLNIHTVEALAQLPASGLAAVGMGAHELQKKATNFLKLATESAAYEKLNKQVEELTKQIEELKKPKATKKKATKKAANKESEAA